MTTTASDAVTVSHAGAGPATWALGSLFERLARADTTGGQLDASLVTQPPGLATPLHVHTRESEAWFVLDGSLTYKEVTHRHRDRDVAGGNGGGDFIYLPRHVPHAFRVTGTSPVRYLALALPGDLMRLYDEVGQPAAERRLPDGGIPDGEVNRWGELAPAFGLQIVGPPIPAPGARST